MAKKKRTARGGSRSAPQLEALDLRGRLRQGERARCYVLLGEEGFLREEALRALTDELLGSEPGPSFSELDGAKAELPLVLDELRTLPFFGAGHRVVAVRRAGSSGNAAGFASEHGEALAAFLKRAPETATLILEAPKLNRRFKGSKALLAAARIVDCSPFDERGLLGFVRQRAEHWGRPFAPGADHALLERLGGHDVRLDQLDAEVGKLASAGEGPISPADIEALAGVGSSEESFALVDCLSRGDAARALDKLRVIYRDGLMTNGERNRDPSGIAFILLGILRWDLGRLLRGRAMLERGAPQWAITEELKVYRDKGRFMERLRRTDREDLGARHRLLREADAALKSSADPRGTLTHVVIRLARREQPARAGPALARR